MKKIIKGGFIKGVLKKSLPYGVVLVLNVLTMIIVQVFVNMNIDVYNTLLEQCYSLLLAT